MSNYPGDDPEIDRRALTAIAGNVFANSPDRRVRTVAEIVDRVRVLVERIRQSQQNEDNLSRVIAALEEAERNRQVK